ncbi:MAG: pyruvate carboxylase [Azospirillum sp.]|nr:pyruvate carboxylase [Azospirillum sp.]
MPEPVKPIKRLLVANRGEIAIRIMRAANELGIATVAVYSHEDKLALHRFKADESYLIGDGLGPVKAYLAIPEYLRIGREAQVDAVHPGYGFLSENPDFAEACLAAGITFIGPSPAAMRLLGNKVAARNLAVEAGVPVMPATGPLPEEDDGEVARLAATVGYPVMLKASWGGGGRGMRVIEGPDRLISEVAAGRREALSAFGNGEVYLEKLVRRARHVEVQVLADHHGTSVHLFERDCTVQRRHQKVVERAPAPYLAPAQRDTLCNHALTLVRAAGYTNAGTVEFLMDVDGGQFFFIEVNPRVQVEHTVTEEVTGIDIVKAQIQIAGGARIGTAACGVPFQDGIHLHGHALQCRITTEDPDSNFVPDYGKIHAYRTATGFGIRLDGGTTYTGAVITRFYDSLLEKVTAWAPTPTEAIARMDRALREFRIRGVATNLGFVETLINHPRFKNADYTTRFIDETPELFGAATRRDRATRLLKFIAEVTVNGNPEVVGRPRPPATAIPPAAPAALPPSPEPGTRDRLDMLGAGGFARWMLAQERVLITDTSMRDAHQSLLATRMRTIDMVRIAPAYARLAPQLFSLECWGGATFDVAMRFLKEDPWERLRDLRQAVPNILLQMLLRSANAVGYTNYPDNVVRYFVQQAAAGGIDLFRVFDSLNWADNMRVAMDAVIETGKLCEAAICYTGDITDIHRSKYSLKYYVGLAKALEKAGAHILGIKDMAGLVKPAAARLLVETLKQEVGLPIHFHTHDTSGISAASVLAAVEAGVDAVDGALDSLSGLTSQPNLGAIAAALRGGPRDSGLDADALGLLSSYWEAVRDQYRAFESEMRAGDSAVYRNEVPGGQYTNLREQARGLKLADKWPEVLRAYADVNQLFGDIVKVTPTSKVVGDLALMMVTSGLTPAEVLDARREVAFPDSVVQLFRGDLGQPVGGWPKDLSRKVLKGLPANTDRPGATLPAVDLAAERAKVEAKVARKLSDQDLASSLMYPKVFEDYARHLHAHGKVSVLPTPVYFYGMQPGQECAIDLERGKTLVIRCLAVGEPDFDGLCDVYFEMNGQPRMVKVQDHRHAPKATARRKAEDGNPSHIAAPMAGLVSAIAVEPGRDIRQGDVLMTIEAMKMETALRADRAGRIKEVVIAAGAQVDAKDLLIVLQTEAKPAKTG